MLEARVRRSVDLLLQTDPSGTRRPVVAQMAWVTACLGASLKDRSTVTLAVYQPVNPAMGHRALHRATAR